MILFRNARFIDNHGSDCTFNVSFDGSSFSHFFGEVSSFGFSRIIDNAIIIPGLCDVHVHLREPGFSYKETVKSGTAAAARGGYTAVCTMPNLNPVPDSMESLSKQLEIIERDAVIAVHPLGSITKGERGEELSDMYEMSSYVVGFSDDGRGVQNEEMMRRAMYNAYNLDQIIVAHCEDNSLLNGGYIHDGEYAKAHGHRGICSESEWGPIKRDISLARETGADYHVCHISTAQSVELVRQAKAEGLFVTCETAPHYILLDDGDLQEEGRFKMNPPLRSPSDREAILRGLLDGTIDMIATDHAPHSAEEKSRGLEGSAMGIVGLETAFPLLYTNLVKTGIMRLKTLVRLMSEEPRRRFKIRSDAGWAVFVDDGEYEIDPEQFVSMGRATPFAGRSVSAKCIMTVYDGRVVYSDSAYLGGEYNG